MPLPNPSSSKNKDDYISLCMSKQKDEPKEQDQKLAICFSKWRKRNESNIIDRINLFIGDQTVTGNVAVNTASCGIVKRKKKEIKENGCPEGTYWCKDEKKCVNEGAGTPKTGDRFKDKKGRKLTVVSVGDGIMAHAGDNIEVKFDGEKKTKDIKMKDFFAPGFYNFIREEKSYLYVVKKGKEFKIPNDPKVIKKYKDKGFEIKESYTQQWSATQSYDPAGPNPHLDLKKAPEGYVKGKKGKLEIYGHFPDKKKAIDFKKKMERKHKKKLKMDKSSPGWWTVSESIFGATVADHGIAGSGQTRAVGDYNQEVMNLKKPVRFNKLIGTFSPVEDTVTEKIDRILK